MKNKLLVITGGTKGIGRALIHQFAQENFDIVTCSRHEADLKELQEEITTAYGVTLSYREADLASKEATLAFADFVKALDRPIDVLINNAGFFQPSAITTEPDELFEKTMSINVFSVYYFTKALLPTLSKEASVFNICSIASNTILSNCGAYGISKFALLGFSKILREELKNQQIKVTSVLPGATFTAAWDGSDIDPARIMPAKDVAKAVWGCYTLSTQSVVEELTIRPQLGDL